MPQRPAFLIFVQPPQPFIDHYVHLDREIGTILDRDQILIGAGLTARISHFQRSDERVPDVADISVPRL